MNDLVYRDYTQVALDEQYNARSTIPTFGAFVQRWQVESEEAVKNLTCTLDIAYGEDPIEILDIFHPAGGGPAPILVFSTEVIGAPATNHGSASWQSPSSNVAQ